MFKAVFCKLLSKSVAAPRGDWGIRPPPPIPKSRQKLSKKKGIKLVGYTFRLKNYVKIPPFLSDLSELAPPLLQIWCYCGHVIKSRTMRHLNFDCQLTLIHMGFFRATIYGGGGGSFHHSLKTTLDSSESKTTWPSYRSSHF